MRLSFIFLTVLAASVLMTALAAWGITYGTSYSRVTTMASEFTLLSFGVLDEFGTFVADVIRGNSELVNTILAQQRASGTARMQQTKADMISTIGTLVNYTTNATAQSQLQMSQVVDTFATLMGTVVEDFRALGGVYAEQLRASLATQVSNLLLGTFLAHIGGMTRYLVLQDLGVLQLNRTAWDPVGADDCNVLGALCATLQDAGPADIITMALPSGRHYTCSATGAFVSVLSKNGSTYSQDLVTWLPYGATVPQYAQKSTKQRCLTDPPDVVQRVAQSCPLPQSCGCGDDQRCEAWYQRHVNDTFPSVDTKAFYISPSGMLYSCFSLSLFDPATGKLLAVVTDKQPFNSVQSDLGSFGASATTLLAIMVNDPILSSPGFLGKKCGANETPPGDTSIPTRSLLRSCDPNLRWVAQWVFDNRAVAQQGPQRLLNGGYIWNLDMDPAKAGYLAVGALLAEINGPIDASNAHATSQLATVRTQQLGLVETSGAATQAYMAAVGAQNVANSQAMEATFLVQISSLENASWTALTLSQQSSSSQVQHLTAVQTAQIDALKAKHLSAMSTTAGWTIGVVLALLLAVLLVSAWGTIQVTLSLIGIIDLMEDVADMKVENLEVPQHSAVKEVARIQTAFQVLVLRLAEYKSYIPAGLFEQQQQQQEEGEAEQQTRAGDGGGGRAGPGADDSDTDPGSSRQLSAARRDHRPSATPSRLSSTASLRAQESSAIILVRKFSMMSSVSHRPGGRRPAQSARKNVVVVSVNILGFMDVMCGGTESNFKNVFNEYLMLVHEAATQYRGNLDCVLGDQLFLTFNAHIPCSDSAGAGMAAALEMRHKLQQQLGSKLQFQIGAAYGPVFASSMGYAKFKSMVTIGSPMKVAFALSRLPRFESGKVLIDAALEERVKFAFRVTPVELVHMPTLKSFAQGTSKQQRISAVFGKKEMEEDEWMYQLQEGKEGQQTSLEEWAATFQQVAAAKTVPDAQRALQQFLTGHPDDPVALRLRDRLSLWVPGLGVPL